MTCNTILSCATDVAFTSMYAKDYTSNDLSLYYGQLQQSEEGEAGNAVHAKLQRASSCVVKRGAVIPVDVRVLGRRVDLEQPAQTFVCETGGQASGDNRRDENTTKKTGRRPPAQRVS